jgi:hypothetical protein
LHIELHRQRADEVTLMQLSTGCLMAIEKVAAMHRDPENDLTSFAIS